MRTLVENMVANKIFNLIFFSWLAAPTAPLFQRSFSAAYVLFAAPVAAPVAAPTVQRSFLAAHVSFADPVAAPAAALVALACCL